MRFEWKSEGVSPYFSRESREWPGLRVHRARVRPGRLLEHTNTFHEVNVALNGMLVTEKISGTGKRVTTYGGTSNLCITPAGQPISARWDAPLDNLGFAIDPQFIARTAAENNFSTGFEFAEIYRAQDPLIQQIGLSLLSESNSPTPSGKLFTDSLMQTLALHLLVHYSTSKAATAHVGGLSPHRLRRVKDFIDANLEDDVSLGDLAREAGLSQYHFAREFRRSVGVTPQQYLMRQRIERAKHLLADARLPLVEVSLRTGFKSQSHFTTLFRKFTNLTPKSWRDIKLA